VSGDIRPDRHALLELDALLDQSPSSATKATPHGSTKTPGTGGVLHRLWIAAGNQALAYTAAAGQAVRADRTWANLYDLRNHLAHSRLPDATKHTSAASPGRAPARSGRPFRIICAAANY